MTLCLLVLSLSAAAIVLAHALFWGVLGLAALPAPRRRTRAEGFPDGYRVAVIVPAHNEERGIERCVGSVLGDGSVLRPSVYVVADNCTDGTAALAAQAGARVLARDDLTRAGKPFALRYALAHLRGQAQPPDVVIIVDADSVVSPGFIDTLAGAVSRGDAVVQSHYRPEVRPTGLGRVRVLAFALAHWARPLGCLRLGLGTSLKGNGMAFTWEVLRSEDAWEGLAEDAGMTLSLARRGIAVRFEPAAEVSGLMAAGYREARTQDLRWEAGRASLRRKAVKTSLGAAARGQFAASAGALEVAAFPLTWLAALSPAAIVAGALAGSPLPALAPAMLALACVLGWLAARVPLSTALAVVELPRFVWHKATVWGFLATGRGPRTWQRTDRGA